MTRETQLPLPAAFFSVPLPLSLLYFFSFCTFSHSAHFQSFLLSALFSISTFVHFHLWVPLPCCLSRLFVVSVMSSPFSCVALHQLKLQILRTSLTDFPLLSVCLCICLPLLTPFPPATLPSLCGHLLWGSLSPSYPNSAVPVGLWAGWVWAPAAFSKASPAAPATDPSNTATLTFIYTCNCRT